MSKVDVLFLEDSGPLEAGPMETLTRSAMAVLGGQWFLTAQLILDTPTMATTLVSDIELLIVLVNLVWGAVFPIIRSAL